MLVVRVAGAPPPPRRRIGRARPKDADPGALTTVPVTTLTAIRPDALYMESLAKHDGFWTLGGCEANRLQYARYRALSGDFLLPLADLSALGREKVQASPDIAKLYAQAAGTAQFLIDGESGSHREAFVDLLAAVYRGNDQLDTLPKAAGVLWGKLDEQYRTFLNVTDDDLAGIPSPDRLRNLSLGRTSVTDTGLAHLAGAKNLEWLDLSGTSVTDKGVAVIADMPRLTQLFLEGTKITDASLTAVGKLKSLEELDLSHLPGITDEGLSALATLRQLKVLHLAGSPIGDAGLAHLHGLKQLESLDTDGTAEGLKKLSSAAKLRMRSAAMHDPFNPSPNEIREWAYDADALQPCQDFDLILKWTQHERRSWCVWTINVQSKTFSCGSLQLVTPYVATTVDTATDPRRAYQSWRRYPHPKIQMWQTRSRELMKQPDRFEYEAWCAGGSCATIEVDPDAFVHQSLRPMQTLIDHMRGRNRRSAAPECFAPGRDTARPTARPTPRHWR